MGNIKASISMEITRDGQEFDVQVSAQGYYDAGRAHGPVDLCYAPEGELEITEVEGPDDVAWNKKLTPEETKRAYSLLHDAVMDGDDDYDGPDNYDVDDELPSYMSYRRR